eukprot:4050125-Pyramimonas_sp.AAC.1
MSVHISYDHSTVKKLSEERHKEVVPSPQHSIRTIKEECDANDRIIRNSHLTDYIRECDVRMADHKG